MPHAPIPPARRANAKRMRKTMTVAELKLWNAIRAHRLMGLGFRRQVPIAGYIVDFACPTHQLIVEVDGWTVLRFWNDEVLKEIDNVCLHILKIVGEA